VLRSLSQESGNTGTWAAMPLTKREAAFRRLPKVPKCAIVFQYIENSQSSTAILATRGRAICKSI
jgi:hypothetical protein